MRQLLCECSAKLADLDLSRTTISGEGLESLPVLNLEKLNLTNCKNLTKTGLLEFLSKCSATLKDLNLSGNEISGEGLESLPVLKLEKLNLNSCRKLTNAGLLELLGKCSATLADLDLTKTNFSGESLADWFERHAPGKLRRLWLSLENVFAADIERIRTALPYCNVYQS